MKPSLRSFFSPDAPSADLRDWAPEDSTTFGVLIQAFIGLEGEEGEDMFQFLVCTPKWLERELAEAHAKGDDKPHVIGHHHVIVPAWDYDLLYRWLIETCERSAGESWSAVTRRLSRYGLWEYQDTEHDK